MPNYTVQTGWMDDGEWRPGSYSKVVAAPDLAAARQEADRLLKEEIATWETGDAIRVFNSEGSSWRPFDEGRGNANWS